MTDAPTSRPMRKDAARNRDLLIRAAREVFAERGLEASLDDVARHAGLGVGTAYRHFANKLELARAIFAEAVAEIVEQARAAAAMDDPWAGIVTFVETAARAQIKDRGLREVLMGSFDPAEMERVNDLITPLLDQLVRRAKADGLVRSDIEATDVGMVVLMLCSVADIAGEVEPELWQRYVPMLLAGLQEGSVLPVAALSNQDFRTAITRHKQRMIRAAHTARSSA